MIYLDSASSHPLLPEVPEALRDHWQRNQGCGENTSARHHHGRALKQQLSFWHEELCAGCGIAPKEWLWASGATEANNLAIRLAQAFYSSPPQVFLHPFAHASLKEPAEREGLDVQLLPLTQEGLVDTAAAEALVAPCLPQALILWPYGDNEWGFIDAPEDLWRQWHQKGAWIHLDAAQSFAKVPLDLGSLPCQSATASGHKFGSLGGIGGLFLRLRPKKSCHPLITGGGQQDNWRSGTVPMSLILSFIIAWRQWEHGGLRSRLAAITQQLNIAMADLPEYQSHHLTGKQLPHLQLWQCAQEAVSFGPHSWLAQHVAYSQGSACQSLHEHGSAALMARGFDQQQQRSFLRLSTHPTLTGKDISVAVAFLKQALKEDHHE